MSAHNNPPPLPFAPPPPEFDDFIEGENHRALSAVRTMSGGGAGASLIYVWGNSGCGKTHLLKVAVAKFRETRKSAFYADSRQPLPPPMPGLLAADDIEKLSAENRLLLFDWQNKQAPGAHYRILAAGNMPPAHLNLGSEIAARLNAGLVFRLSEITETEKRRALARYARRRGFELPESVMHLFLTRLPRDMTSLIAAIADLDGFLLAKQKPLTVALARQWLQAKAPLLIGDNADDGGDGDGESKNNPQQDGGLLQVPQTSPSKTALPHTPPPRRPH